MHPCVRDAKPPSFYVNAALVMLRKGNTGVFAFPLVPFQGSTLEFWHETVVSLLSKPKLSPQNPRTSKLLASGYSCKPKKICSIIFCKKPAMVKMA
ncbi:hypothetical protein V6N13_100104 [Hibiscus sabdariffa]